MYGGESSHRPPLLQGGKKMQYPDFYTKEMIDISERNRAATRKLLNVPKGYHMHHIDEELRHNDPWRYIQ